MQLGPESRPLEMLALGCDEGRLSSWRGAVVSRCLRLCAVVVSTMLEIPYSCVTDDEEFGMCASSRDAASM